MAISWVKWPGSLQTVKSQVQDPNMGKLSKVHPRSRSHVNLCPCSSSHSLYCVRPVACSHWPLRPVVKLFPEDPKHEPMKKLAVGSSSGSGRALSAFFLPTCPPCLPVCRCRWDARWTGSTPCTIL